jgi:hypothetical protein
MMGSEYKNLPEDELKIYKNLALIEKERFLKETAEYNKKSNGKIEKNVKSKNSKNKNKEDEDVKEEGDNEDDDDEDKDENESEKDSKSPSSFTSSSSLFLFFEFLLLTFFSIFPLDFLLYSAVSVKNLSFSINAKFL